MARVRERRAPQRFEPAGDLQYRYCAILSPFSDPMPDDLPLFLASVALFGLYLVFSALTEMGTKFPWRSKK